MGKMNLHGLPRTGLNGGRLQVDFASRETDRNVHNVGGSLQSGHFYAFCFCENNTRGLFIVVI